MVDAKESKKLRAQSKGVTSKQVASTSKSIVVFVGLTTPWEEFYRSQTERLSRMAANLGVPIAHLADALQEVWLDAWKHRAGFQGKDVDQRLASWLSTVTVNKSRDSLRHVRRRQRNISLEALSTQPESKTKEAAESMEAEERGNCLNAEFEELRRGEPLNGWLVWERIVEGRSIRDLAAEAGLSEHAVSCRIGRTLKKLRIRLCELGPVPKVSGKSGARVREKK